MIRSVGKVKTITCQFHCPTVNSVVLEFFVLARIKYKTEGLLIRNKSEVRAKQIVSPLPYSCDDDYGLFLSRGMMAFIFDSVREKNATGPAFICLYCQ